MTVEIRVREMSCYCRKQMGNDFWFLPANECLRKPHTGRGACNARTGTVIGQSGASWNVHWDGEKYGAKEYGSIDKNAVEVIA